MSGSSNFRIEVDIFAIHAPVHEPGDGMGASKFDPTSLMGRGCETSRKADLQPDQPPGGLRSSALRNFPARRSVWV
jgi:hypothetical protein